MGNIVGNSSKHLLCEVNYGFEKDFVPAVKDNMEKELETEGVIQITLPNRTQIYVASPKFCNDSLENKKSNLASKFAKHYVDSVVKRGMGRMAKGPKQCVLGSAESEGKFKAAIPEDGNYVVCTTLFKPIGSKLYFDTLDAIAKEFKFDFAEKVAEGTEALTNMILEGKNINRVLSFHESMNKELKTAVGQFPKKMDAFYIEAGGVHDAAVNLHKYGRDYVQEGVYDRKYLDWLMSEAADILKYYNTRIKSRIDALGLDEDDDDLNSINDDVNTLEWVTKWDLDTIDLNKLKRAF